MNIISELFISNNNLFKYSQTMFNNQLQHNNTIYIHLISIIIFEWNKLENFTHSYSKTN
jgi:hypothetical protein